jgi:hypothetical protein
MFGCTLMINLKKDILIKNKNMSESGVVRIEW